MPFTYSDKKTLVIKLFDNVKKITILLRYNLFKETDVIVKNVKYINNSFLEVKLTKTFSAIFVLGILCYFLQIWTFDNTDWYERVKI